jgi:TonB family protein
MNLSGFSESVGQRQFPRSLARQVQLEPGIYFAGCFGLKDMIVTKAKRILAVCLLAVLTLASGGAISLRAQVGDISETRRKVKVLVRPQYPELAKKLSLSGLVKIEVTIGPDGKVKRAHTVGGHPVLATEAEKAALQSEFEPGPKETTEIIEFKFSPQ